MFEYHTITVDQSLSDALTYTRIYMDQVLKDHADKGWELVSVCPTAGNVYFVLFFKRKKKPS